MAKVYVNGFLICPTMADADMVSREMAEHIRLTRAEPGCEKFEIVRSHEDPLRFAVFEVFRDAAAFRGHQARTRDSDWARKTAHIERDFNRS